MQMVKRVHKCVTNARICVYNVHMFKLFKDCPFVDKSCPNDVDKSVDNVNENHMEQVLQC